MDNFFSSLKNMHTIKEKLEEVQDSFSSIEEVGFSGGGLVKVKLAGNLTMLSIEIDPSLLESKDVKMLQDLIVAAYANAAEKVNESMREQIAPISAAIKGL